MRTCFASLFLVFLTAPSLVAVAESAVDPKVAGKWMIVREGGGKGCVLNFEEGSTIGGQALTGADVCTGSVAELQDAYAWDVEGKGQIVIRDTGRQTLARLTEAPGGLFAEEKPAGDRLVLVRPTAGVDRIFGPRDLFGTWEIRRQGKKTGCLVALTLEPAPGSALDYAVSLSGACGKDITDLALGGWRPEGLEIVLTGEDGKRLSFAPTSKTQAKPTAKTPKALTLVKS